MERRKPNVRFFHAFGYKCFVLNNDKDNLGKFDSKSDEAILLGYSTTSKAFRVFNKCTLIVEESVMLFLMNVITFLPRILQEMKMQVMNQIWKTWKSIKAMRSIKKTYLKKNLNKKPLYH